MTYRSSKLSDYMFGGRYGINLIISTCVTRKYNSPLEFLRSLLVRMDRTGETQIYSSPVFRSIIQEWLNTKCNERGMFCDFVMKKWSSILDAKLSQAKSPKDKVNINIEKRQIIGWLQNNRLNLSEFLVCYCEIRLLESV